MKRRALALALAAALAVTATVAAETALAPPPVPPAMSPASGDTILSASDAQVTRWSGEAAILGTVIAALVMIGGAYMGWLKLLEKRDTRVIAREARFQNLREEFISAQSKLTSAVATQMAQAEQRILGAIATHRDEAKTEITHLVRYQEQVTQNVESLRDDIGQVREDVSGVRRDVGRLHGRVDDLYKKTDWDGKAERRNG